MCVECADVFGLCRIMQPAEKKSKRTGASKWAATPRNVLREILTFLEITSWHIELMRVCQGWRQCIPKREDKIYQDAITQERKGDTFTGRDINLSEYECHGLRDGFVTLLRLGPLFRDRFCSRCPLTLIARRWTSAPCCSNCDVLLETFVLIPIAYNPTDVAHRWLFGGLGAFGFAFNNDPPTRTLRLCNACFKAQAEMTPSTEGTADEYELTSRKVTCHGVKFDLHPDAWVPILRIAASGASV
jgi:hypothetical protein